MRKYYATFLPTNSTDVNDIWSDIVELEDDEKVNYKEFDAKQESTMSLA